MNKVEVIAWTLDDAIEIYKSGADRIELVSEMEKGGLSPNLEIVKQVVEIVDIPVRVMVRHTDESFVYDSKTMSEHIQYINELKKIGPEGIVFGSLTEEGLINFEQLQEVIDAKGEMKLVFHRAFDELPKLHFLDQFDRLSKYDVDTLLTSGTCRTAEVGVHNIKNLVDRETINILPGKSITVLNARKIVKATGVEWVHVGYAARDNNDIDGKISKDKIRYIKESINS